MILAKFQDEKLTYKNQLYVYRVARNNQKIQFNIPLIIATKKSEILRDKPNKRYIILAH